MVRRTHGKSPRKEPLAAVVKGKAGDEVPEDEMDDLSEVRRGKKVPPPPEAFI